MSQTPAQIMRDYLLGLQQRITWAISEIDGKAFLSDGWEKAPQEPLQGNGVTQILEDGKLFERAAAASRMCAAPACRPRRPSTAPSSPAPRSRPWACRWYSTRATPMCPPCT